MDMPRSPVNAQPLALFSQAASTISTDRHRRNNHALQKAQFGEEVAGNRAKATAAVTQDLHVQAQSLKAKHGVSDDEAWDMLADQAPEAFASLAGNSSAVEGANNLRIQQAGADDDRRFTGYEQEMDPETGQPTGRLVRQYANAKTKSIGPETVGQTADDDDEVVRISRGQALRELAQGGMASAGRYGHTFGEGAVAAAGDVNQAHLEQMKAMEQELYSGFVEQGMADEEARVEARAEVEKQANIGVDIPAAGAGGDLQGFAQEGGSGQIVPDSGMSPADLERRDPGGVAIGGMSETDQMRQALDSGPGATMPADLIRSGFRGLGYTYKGLRFLTSWASENGILNASIAEALSPDADPTEIKLAEKDEELLRRRSGAEGPVGTTEANDALADPSVSAKDRKTNAALYTMELPGVAGLPEEAQRRTIEAGADVLGTARTPRQIQAYARMMARTQTSAQERTPQQLRAALYMHSLDQLSTPALEKFVGGQAIAEEPPGDPVVMTRDGRMFDRRTNKFLEPDGMSPEDLLKLADKNTEFSGKHARMALASDGAQSSGRASWYQRLEPAERDAAEAGTLGVAMQGRNLIMNMMEAPDGSTVDITNPALRQDLRVMAFSIAADVYHSQVNERTSGWGPWKKSSRVYSSMRDHPLFAELMEGLREEVQ